MEKLKTFVFDVKATDSSIHCGEFTYKVKKCNLGNKYKNYFIIQFDFYPKPTSMVHLIFTKCGGPIRKQTMETNTGFKSL